MRVSRMDRVLMAALKGDVVSRSLTDIVVLALWGLLAQCVIKVCY